MNENCRFTLFLLLKKTTKQKKITVKYHIISSLDFDLIRH